jgi:hypothetical protein
MTAKEADDRAIQCSYPWHIPRSPSSLFPAPLPLPRSPATQCAYPPLPFLALPLLPFPFPAPPPLNAVKGKGSHSMLISPLPRSSAYPCSPSHCMRVWNCTGRLPWVVDAVRDMSTSPAPLLRSSARPESSDCRARGRQRTEPLNGHHGISPAPLPRALLRAPQLSLQGGPSPTLPPPPPSLSPPLSR